jgi:A/G-specific adenine glycosylase
MLQQTRVAAVLGYYARFLAVFPTVEALAETDEELLMKLWEGLGYYSRARNLQKAAREITALGGFPDTYDGLLALPETIPPPPLPPQPSDGGNRRWTATCSGS